MAINATNNGTTRDLIPSGNYIARCYQMIHIGTITDVVVGTPKTINKVRIGWELPTELKVFKEENGPQPLVISQEYNLAMNEKANLRKMLASWRGKDFTEEEAKCFDVTKLIGVPCMLNIIHRPSKTDASKIYESIGSVSPIPKGVPVPAQIQKSSILQYDSFDWDLFNALPDFIKQKVQSSAEFKAMQSPQEKHITNAEEVLEPFDDLPF